MVVMCVTSAVEVKVVTSRLVKFWRWTTTLGRHRSAWDMNDHLLNHRQVFDHHQNRRQCDTASEPLSCMVWGCLHESCDDDG